MATPYRSQDLARAPSIRPWASIVGRVVAALAALAWVGTFALAYQREAWGVSGAEVATWPTGFAIGCLLLAKRTRYRPDAAGRIAAPLACGLLGGWIAVLFGLFFFGIVWHSL